MGQVNNVLKTVPALIVESDFQPKELDFTKYAISPNLDCCDAFAEFRNDALEACGITDHPRASFAFDLACENGNELRDIFFNLQDYANLIRGLK